jgi:hypothetical protein
MSDQIALLDPHTFEPVPGAPLGVSPKLTARILNCSTGRVYQLMGSDELESYQDGRSRKATVRGISAYMKRRLAAAAEVKTLKPRKTVAASELAAARAREGLAVVEQDEAGLGR